MTPLFFYGTLKRGGDNHHYLAGQRFLGPARTRAGFRLYDLGGYPGMVPADDRGRAIEGEIWAVDGPCLARLDELEGTAAGLYTREPIGLQPPHEALPVQTYLYRRSVVGRRDLGTSYP